MNNRHLLLKAFPKKDFSYLHPKIFLKIFSTLILLLSISITSNSQSMCGFDEYKQELLDQNPEYFEELELQLQETLRSGIRGSRNANIVIPVIFHIVHTGINSPTNIDYSRITNALVSLNADFANSGIQFCPALRDPNGNPVPDVSSGDIAGEFGVKRVDGSSSGYSGSITLGGTNEPIIKGLSYFITLVI